MDWLPTFGSAQGTAKGAPFVTGRLLCLAPEYPDRRDRYPRHDRQHHAPAPSRCHTTKAAGQRGLAD